MRFRSFLPLFFGGLLCCVFQSAASAQTAARADVPSPGARQVVLVIDRSGSIDSVQIRHQKQLTADVVRSLGFGDRLVVLVAHRNGVKGAAPSVFQMPDARRRDRPLTHEARSLATAQRMASRTTGALFSGPPVPGTDLLATLHTVGDLIQGPAGARVSLLMLSDMLQCADGVCIEKPGQRIPDAAWIEGQKRQGTLPALNGACIAAVGVDASTAHGVRVRDFWNAYFRAAGARIENHRWRHVVADVAPVLCG